MGGTLYIYPLYNVTDTHITNTARERQQNKNGLGIYTNTTLFHSTTPRKTLYYIQIFTKILLFDKGTNNIIIFISTSVKPRKRRALNVNVLIHVTKLLYNVQFSLYADFIYLFFCLMRDRQWVFRHECELWKRKKKL